MAEISVTAWGKAITVSYPDDMDGMAPTAFADSFGYLETVPGPDGDEIDNPQGREEFCIGVILDWVKSIILDHSVKGAADQAGQDAKAATGAKLDGINVIIEGN